MEKFITTAGGLTLWTESFGMPQHPSVLLVMGAMNQGIFWPDEFCKGLALAGFYVIRYDHRDTGKSSKVNFQKTPYDLDTLAEDAADVIRGHQLVRPVIIGLSMGGYVTQLVATKHPEIAKRLVLISTTADHRPYMAATTGQSTSGFSLPRPEQKFLDYVDSAIINPPQTHAQMMESMSQGWAVTYGGHRPYPKVKVEQALRFAVERSPDISSVLHHGLAVAVSPHRLELVKAIATPTLVIHGRHDPCLPLAHGNYLVEHIPNAKLEVLEMGHSFMWSWDTEVLAAVLQFAQTE